jgi:hypothetical protein
MRLRENAVNIKSVILRLGFGRRLFRNESDLVAASWLLHEDLRRNAATPYARSNHRGRSFGQNRPQDDSSFDEILSTVFFRSP